MTERRELPYEWRDLKRRLKQSQWLLYKRLGLKGRVDAQGVFMPLNPTRADKKPGSFVVYTDSEKAGGWVEYARPPDTKGDIFDLIIYCERLAGKMDAYWWALDFLGLDRKGSNEQPRRQHDAQRAEAEAAERRALAEAEAKRIGEAKSAALFKLWLGLPPISGTPAERYLREARGIPLERLNHQPGALRWGEAVEWIDPATGEVFTWRHVMVSAMTKGKKLVALHRTFLKPDGSGKAAREKAKTMIGPARGAAIRLAAGPSGLSPTAAEKKGRRDPLMIGEGIETVLTAAAARPDYRAWAAGSLSLMGVVDWPACASAVVLLRDNDWGGQAVEAFKAVEAHWRGQAEGRPVAVVASAVGNDFNDWVKA